MTHATKHAPRLTAACPGPRDPVRGGLPSRDPAAMLAALLVAGCSTGHIGESWQCPLAEGGLCDSVAAADPAVPDPGASDGTVLREPLWRVRSDERAAPAPSAAPPCDAGCGGFGPLGWLARLFAAETHEDEARPAGGSAVASSAPAARRPAPIEEDEAPAAARTGEPDSAPLPAEAGLSRDESAREGSGVSLPAEAEAALDGPEAGDLRTGEIVARIWIAPFVDANGVYREASHVRVVLEPAGWRLR